MIIIRILPGVIDHPVQSRVSLPLLCYLQKMFVTAVGSHGHLLFLESSHRCFQNIFQQLSMILHTTEHIDISKVEILVENIVKGILM